MKDVLAQIVETKRTEVASYRTKRRSMSQSLLASPHGIIAEFKRKSPSKGWIHADAQPMDVVPLYDRGGAAALSILTDEPYFGGRADFITQVRPHVSAPILRKEFIIDECQIHEAKTLGADAVLLIAACLTLDQAERFVTVAHCLGLETLMEIHSEAELDYTRLGSDMVGVNNRNLGTFHTDVANSFRLAQQLPTDAVLVSESGISNPATVRQLRQVGYRGFLIGETFMRQADPGKALTDFVAQI